jgi:rare lipoprotein A
MITFQFYKHWLKSSFFSVGLFICLVEPSFALTLNSSEIVLAVQRETTNTSVAAKKSFSGNVSWYGRPFHGKKTASGEIFDMNKLTAAHLKLPFGTRVLVEDPKTGNTVIVKVNDRGPYVKSRVMDLAKEGARELGTLGRGVAYVDCLVLSD